MFPEIGKRLGPFDLAAIPIGAYEPRCIQDTQHCNPTEAIKILQVQCCCKLSPPPPLPPFPPRALTNVADVQREHLCNLNLTVRTACAKVAVMVTL